MDKKILIYLLLILTPIWISIRFYSGPGAQWVTGSLSGIVFVLFWCLLLRLLLTGPKNFTLTTGVFLTFCGLEFLQLWNPSVLEAIRNTFLGQLLGLTFSWNAFPYYFLGAFIGQQILNRGPNQQSQQDASS